MLSNEQMAVAGRALADQAIALVEQHERDSHGGEACWANRAALIGYLAHCLGANGLGDWFYAQQVCHEYDVNCTANDCHPKR